MLELDTIYGEEQSMISNQKLLVAIREIKEITGIDVTLYLPNGKLVAETGGTSEAVTERISLFA